MDATDLPTSYRALLNHIRQELIAPAQNLLEMCQILQADGAKAQLTAAILSDFLSIDRNAAELYQRISRILEGGLDSHDQSFDGATSFEGFVRHELRSPANRVILRCEILAEDSAEDLPPLFQTSIERIREKAWQVVRSIDHVVSFSQTKKVMATTGSEWIGEIFTPADPRQRTARGNILVVDDNEDNREIFERKLKEDKHTVFTASSGRDAIHFLEVNPGLIDVILLDVIMPEMNGMQVLEFLKQHPVFHSLPVVMISALDAIDHVVRCLETGAEDYLPKTCDPILLHARIGASLEKKRLRERETQLLHAILPSKLVAEYRETNSISPRRHERVGVLFLDIVGFTSWSEKNPPEVVIDFLERMVTTFEKILEDYPVEKIKTIGDAFMCTSGLLSQSPNPVRSLVECGLKMIRAAKECANFDVRIGIHIGPVVAGKLGHRQFTFDLWGQTVNLAARMESNGKPGGITLSPTAWAEIAQSAQATGRLVSIKGLQEMMEVWDFLEFR